jgi:phosphoserine phosphatase RsbU/P
MADEWDRQRPPRLTGYESWLYQMPCTGTGDFFVSVPLPEHSGFSAELPTRWLVAIGDFGWSWREYSRLKDLMEAETRRLAGTAIDPASILEALNIDPLGTGDVSCVLDSFACLLVALVDSDRHEMTLASAGHVSPLVRRVNRQTELLGGESAGLPLWVDPNQTYENVTMPIGPGEILVFYSDGVTELMDNQSNLFRPERLRQAISQAGGDASSVGQSILEATRRFGQGRAQIDDISLLCVGRALQQASHKRGA